MAPPIPNTGLTPEQLMEQRRLATQSQMAQQARANPAPGGPIIDAAVAKAINDYLSGATTSLDVSVPANAAPAVESMLTSGGYSAAPSASSALAATPEANAAWNSAATEAGGGLAGPGMSTLGTAVSGLAALHGGYNLAENFGRGDWKSGAMSGAEAGAGIGAFVGAPWAGAGIGAVVGGLTGLVKSGKHEDQLARDQVRKAMQQKGLLDNGFNLTLAKGGKFNIGVDGGARPEYEFSGGRRPYEVKTESPFAAQAVAWADPIAKALTGGNAKLATDFAGYFANASMSDAESIEGVRANMLNIMSQMGIDANGLKQAVNSLAVSPEDKKAMLYSIDTMMNGKGYYVGSWEASPGYKGPIGAPTAPTKNLPIPQSSIPSQEGMVNLPDIISPGANLPPGLSQITGSPTATPVPRPIANRATTPPIDSRARALQLQTNLLRRE